MNVLILTARPADAQVEQSVKAYTEAGFETQSARSLIEALELAKTKYYSLLVIERTFKEANSDDEIFSVIKAVSINNPECKAMSQGWQSKGLHYFISRDYDGKDHLEWFKFLREIYQELGFSTANLH